MWYPWQDKCDYQGWKSPKVYDTESNHSQPNTNTLCTVHSVEWASNEGTQTLYLDAFQYLSLEYQKVSQSVNAPLLPNIQRGIHVLKR